MNQSKIAVVVDSTAQIPKPIVQQYNIHVIPQTLIWGQETFLDDVDITPTEFYSRLRTDPEFPTTSQATVDEFRQLFENIGQEADGILAILVSSEVSGTLNSAQQAKALLPNLDIELVDSRTISMALGFIALAAIRGIEQGKSLAEATKLARESLDSVGVYITVETLDYLHRGGRIGGARKLLGTALNIKPILTVREGVVAEGGKARTRKKALRQVVDNVASDVEGRSNLQISALHAAAPGDAAYLLDMASERLQPSETHISEISPVVGTHCGPGTVGLAWYADA